MNNILEFLPVAATAIGMAFGFGKQSAAIATLRRDVDAIHKLHRDGLILLNDIDRKLNRLDQLVEILRERGDISLGRRRDEN